MRARATRTLPITRSAERRFERRPSPLVAPPWLVTPRALRARGGVGLGSGAVVFLSTYVVLQVLHALGRDPKIVAAIAPIPLFARFVAGAACGLCAGMAIGHGVRDPERWLRVLPAVMTASIVLFVITIAFGS